MPADFLGFLHGLVDLLPLVDGGHVSEGDFVFFIFVTVDGTSEGSELIFLGVRVLQDEAGDCIFDKVRANDLNG